MIDKWIVVKPGRPAGPFWGVVASSGRVIAMQIPEESIAHYIADVHNRIDEIIIRIDLLISELRATEAGKK